MTSTPAVAVRSQFSRHIVYVPRNWERYHVSRLYGPLHRSLQGRFDTRWLADNVETRMVLTEIPQEHKAFIESRDMFFLSTIDHHGRPTVSYKSGDPGFVRVLDSRTVAFPCYDGSGMFYSIGNVLGKGDPAACSASTIARGLNTSKGSPSRWRSRNWTSCPASMPQARSAS
jgi:hypothetical protein